MRSMAVCLRLGLLVLLAFVAISPMFAQRSLITTFFQSGQQAYQKGDYKDALRIFRQCEEVAKSTKLKPVDESILAYALGETLRVLGHYPEAETRLKQALSIADSLPPRQRNYFYVFNGLGFLYAYQSKFSEAEAMWKQSEATCAKNDPQLSYPVGNLAHHYSKWGKRAEQEAYINKLAVIAQKHPDTLALPTWQFTLGELNEQKGLYKDAETKYREALVTCAKQRGESHPYCALVLTGLAELQRKQGNYADAEKSLRSAIKIYEAQYPPEHPDIAETKRLLALVLCEAGRYAEARDLAQEALKTEETTFGTGDNLFTAKAKDCLGNIYRQYGRYQEAQQFLQQALTSQRRILGADNFEVATTMQNLARVEEDLANFKEAESLLKSSLAIIERETGPDHPGRAEVNSALAHLYLRDEKFSEAEPLFKKALSTSQGAQGSNQAVVAGAARDLGQLYMRQQKYSDAETYLQKALTIDEQIYGAKSPQVAADLLTLATVYGANNQADKAEPLLKRAAQIKNVLGDVSAASDVGPTATSAASDRPVNDKWALVIGISNFKDSSINLKFAAKDATDFRNFLINTQRFRPDHVKLLTDESATRENIVGLLGEKWLATHVKKDDLVVVFVSSHGSSASSDAGGTNFLLAYNTNKNSLLATGIPMQWFTKMITDQVRSDRVILLLDVCHSGAAGEGRKALTRTIGMNTDALKIGTGQLLICSSLANQVSWESRNYENSVFTRCLMDALKAQKEQTTLFNAYKQLRVSVESEVLRDRGELQTPLLVSKYWLGKDPVLAIPTRNSQ